MNKEEKFLKKQVTKFICTMRNATGSLDQANETFTDLKTFLLSNTGKDKEILSFGINLEISTKELKDQESTHRYHSHVIIEITKKKTANSIYKKIFKNSSFKSIEIEPMGDFSSYLNMYKCIHVEENKKILKEFYSDKFPYTDKDLEKLAKKKKEKTIMKSAKIMKNIKQGVEPIKIIEDNPSFLRNYNTIQKIQNDVLNKKIKDQKFRGTLQNKNLIIMGAAGCGKTSSVHEIIKTRGEFLRSKTANKWFDAFPEKFLTTYLIDDVAPEFITEFETEVKMWTDRTPFMIEYKGGTRLLSPICRGILTSNYNQEELLSRLADNNGVIPKSPQKSDVFPNSPQKKCGDFRIA